jgi:hypothetical protein
MAITGRRCAEVQGPVLAPEPDQAALYYCPRCEVYGRGAKCWCCATTQLDWGYVPQFQDELPTGNRLAGAPPAIPLVGSTRPARTLAAS